MYSEDEINAAIERVEIARQNNPLAFTFLDKLDLDPSMSYAAYARRLAIVHSERMTREDRDVIYAAAWLNGLAVGHELGKGARLTDAERERVLWWLHRPVAPGPAKVLDETIIRKLT